MTVGGGAGKLFPPSGSHPGGLPTRAAFASQLQAHPGTGRRPPNAQTERAGIAPGPLLSTVYLVLLLRILIFVVLLGFFRLTFSAPGLAAENT
jgi:hypothetical protein